LTFAAIFFTDLKFILKGIIPLMARAFAAAQKEISKLFCNIVYRRKTLAFCFKLEMVLLGHQMHRF